MADMTAFEEMCQNMRAQWPGMPEKDVKNIVSSAMITGIYTLGQDSCEREDVTKGKLIDGSFVSNIYPNSTHPYKVYLPAEYDDSKAYPLMIFLDGISEYLSPLVKANIVLDNLISDKRLPEMLAIFLEPGDNGEGMPLMGGKFGGPRSNRSLEYDSVDDTFARFLLEELLPQINNDYSFTDDPELHAICGSSSGAQAAFNAAWHRPDAFRKVICSIGSFIAIRGGDCNPDRIRKNYPKPLRVFIQDCENNLNNMQGDLVLANKQMASALEYRGYDYKYVLGKGGHNYEFVGALLPEMLEWIWR